MLLLGLLVAAVQWRDCKPSKLQCLVLFVLIAPGFSAVVSLAVADPQYWSWARLDHPSRYLLIGPLFLVMSRLSLSMSALFWALVFGCFAAGTMGVVDAFVQGQHKASGQLGHHILFGTISASMATLSLLLGCLHFPKRRWWFVFGLLGFVAGALAALLSGARGAWFSATFVLVFAPLLIWPGRLWLKGFMILGLVTASCIALYHAPIGNVKHRVDTAVSDLRHYPHPGGQRSSVGARLEMWQAASIIFLDNVLFGAGPRTFKEESAKLVVSGQVRDFVVGYRHAHNQYLNTLSATGVIGFIALMALLCVPVVIAWPYRQAGSWRHRQCAAVLMVLTLGYAASGLTETIFDRHAAIMFYLVLVSVCLSQLPMSEGRRCTV
jgi:O-antigen ligase